MYIGYIYKITNKTNGKSYIGKTIDLNRRFAQHCSGRGGTKALSNAIKKYDKDNFTFECIECVTTNNLKELNTTLNERECCFIKEYNTFRVGYNCTIGGEGTAYYKHSVETKQKISESHKGKSLSNIIKLKIANKLKGRKRDAAMIAKAAIKRRKSIIQYDIHGSYIREYKGISIPKYNESNIIACCKGRINSAYGYIWRYKGSNLPINTDKKIHISNKPVLQFLDGELVREYLSATEASKLTSIGRKAVVNCLTGRSKSAGGYLWTYKEGGMYE